MKSFAVAAIMATVSVTTGQPAAALFAMAVLLLLLALRPSLMGERRLIADHVPWQIFGATQGA